MSKVSSRRISTGRRVVGPWVCALALVLSSCGLDQVEIPPLGGPSSLGLDIFLEITPDVLTANAVSTASVRATLRGPNGQPVAGRKIFFQITDDDGSPVAIGQLGPTSDRTPNNRPPEVTEVTGGDGVAQVIYRVPERISFNDVQFIRINARLVGTDATGQNYKFVRLELRPAEARTFPPNPDNAPPECSFIVEPSAGPYTVHQTLRLTSTASDADGKVIRYFWDFGDGHSEDGKTELDHAYDRADTYVITHVCTDNNGGQDTKTVTVTIEP